VPGQAVTKKNDSPIESRRADSTKDPLRSRFDVAGVRLSGEENVRPLSRTLHHRDTSEFRAVVTALGRALSAMRRERGWTVEEAAGRFAVEPAFVRRIEAGRTNPSLAVLVSIATAYGVRPDDLLRESAPVIGEVPR
jgi:ribosome-binding protein aMBF1 (putative translation factor)